VKLPDSLPSGMCDVCASLLHVHMLCSGYVARSPIVIGLAHPIAQTTATPPRRRLCGATEQRSVHSTYVYLKVKAGGQRRGYMYSGTAETRIHVFCILHRLIFIRTSSADERVTSPLPFLRPCCTRRRPTRRRRPRRPHRRPRSRRCPRARTPSRTRTRRRTTTMRAPRRSARVRASCSCGAPVRPLPSRCVRPARSGEGLC
jgi:hypothetical protein